MLLLQSYIKTKTHFSATSIAVSVRTARRASRAFSATDSAKRTAVKPASLLINANR